MKAVLVDVTMADQKTFKLNGSRLYLHVYLIAIESTIKIISICNFAMLIYTVSQKKLCHFYFYCNFGKCWSIFKILSMSESERKGS